MGKWRLFTWYGFACVLFTNALAAEPAFQTTREEMMRILASPVPGPVAMPKGYKGIGGYKGLSPEPVETVEVMRAMKGVAVRDKKKPVIVRVERKPAPRLNLKIEFDFDSARIRPGSRYVLDELAGALRDPSLQDVRVAVNGHTDSVGTREYNFGLSFRRAQAVRDYLVRHYGISPDRLEVAGFGEGKPLVADAGDPYKQQLNRRVEIERLR